MKDISDYNNFEEYILDFSDFNEKAKYFKVNREGNILVKDPSYNLELAYMYFLNNKKSEFIEYIKYEDIVKTKSKKINRHSSLRIEEVEDRFFRSLFNRDKVHSLTLANELLLRDNKRFFDIVYLNAKLSIDSNRLIKIYLFENIFRKKGVIYPLLVNLLGYITGSIEGYGEYLEVDELVKKIYEYKFNDKIEINKEVVGINKFLLELLEGEI